MVRLESRRVNGPIGIRAYHANRAPQPSIPRHVRTPHVGGAGGSTLGAAGGRASIAWARYSNGTAPRQPGFQGLKPHLSRCRCRWRWIHFKH